MTFKYEIPSRKRFWPWLAGAAVTGAVWQALLQFADASGAFAIYVALILGFNAYAVAAAGVAKPPEEEDEGFFLSPHKS